MYSKFKITDKFIDLLVSTTIPLKNIDENNKKIISNISLKSKFLLISKHALMRFRERLFANTSAIELSRYIQNYKDPIIYLISNKRSIVEKFYEVSIKIGELPVIIYIVDKNDDTFIMSTIYPDINNKAIIHKILSMHTNNVMQEMQKEKERRFTSFLIDKFFNSREKYDEFFKESFKRKKINKINKYPKESDENFTNSLIEGYFGSKEKHDEFFNEPIQKELIVKRKIKVSNKKVYKGNSFDDIFDNIKTEHEEIDID